MEGGADAKRLPFKDRSRVNISTCLVIVQVSFYHQLHIETVLFESHTGAKSHFRCIIVLVLFCPCAACYPADNVP